MKLFFTFAVLVIASTKAGKAETFHKVKLVAANGKEISAELDLDNHRLTCKTSTATVAEVPYADITKLSYEVAAHHRVKEGALLMAASLGVGGVVMLTKTKKHWLYVDYTQPDGTSTTLTLKLDKSEYEKVLSTAKVQTGKEIETLAPVKEEAKKPR